MAKKGRTSDFSHRAVEAAIGLAEAARTPIPPTGGVYEGGGRDERRRKRLVADELTTKGTGEPEHPGFRRPGEASFGEEATPSNQPDWPQFGNK